MDEYLSLYTAAHLHVDEVRLVGAFTTLEKALKACEDYHAGHYKDGALTEFEWNLDYLDDGKTVYEACTKDPQYEDYYYIEICTLDDSIDDGAKERALNRRLTE